MIHTTKRIYLLLFCALFSYSANAQLEKTDDVKKSLETTNKDTVAWIYGGILTVGANQGFIHNWAAGGEVLSASYNGIFSGHVDRLMHRAVWSNNLDLFFGATYSYSGGFKPHKTDDRIDFTSKFGHRLGQKNWFATALFNFKSQFTKGFDYNLPNWDSVSNSAFMSPAYFTLALGLEYRRGTDLSLFFSPIAARMTVVDKFYTSRSPEGAYGVPYNETHIFQLGAYFSGRYATKFNERVSYRTRLDLYMNYLAKDKKDSLGNVVKRDNPGNISVLFDNLLAWKLAKSFAMTIGATLIYDNNIPYSKTYVNSAGIVVDKTEPGNGMGWVQLKQIFVLGIEYKF